ncbi:MAG TPA: amylo-alpha-1,6-glucosidase [Polyangia bacterium]|nr:amylo-alpha-1,6-glucosidase [Polyangia bacterium]
MTLARSLAPRLVVPGEVAGELDGGTRREWLETNGFGGFAMGTIAGPATRRYHALLCAATRPPVARMVLVNRCEEELELDGARHALGANFYPDVTHPDGHRALVEFRLDPWPTWTYRVGGARVERSLFMPHGRQATVVTWRLVDAGDARARLRVRPLISGRDYHALHHENAVLNPEVQAHEGLVIAAPYQGVPELLMHHNGVYAHRPDWWRQLAYPVERERGLDWQEDLFSPGELSFALSGDTQAVLVFAIDSRDVPDVAGLRAAELERRAALVDGIADPVVASLTAAGDQFLVARGARRTVIAGYPWFTDWGRDTFISLPGLARAAGAKTAREILLAFAAELRDGLIPNRFPDGAEEPEYNTVDAPLWFALAACRLARDGDDPAPLLDAARRVIEGYLAGTRHGIGVDDDGLIHAAAPGLALTWMDARVGEQVITPRQGKPVEIQALWIAVLEALERRLTAGDPTFARELGERAAWARSSFAATFWCEERGWLYDVVDGARRDATLRPNQLYALGLCAPLVDAERAEQVLAACERELLTPVGLRTRSRDESYAGRITGDQRARDAAYHQGTVWPFLLGIYADACVRVRGRVRDDLLDGLRAHVAGEGLGTLHEIFDGDAPHAARGCPSQAWSVAEFLRITAGALGTDV